VTGEDEPEPAPTPRGRGCLIPAVIASAILVLMCAAGGILRYATGFRPVGVSPSAGPTTTAPAASPSPTPTPAVTVPPTTTPPATTSAIAPRVDTLKISQAPSCTSTGSGGTFAGQIRLQWTVSGGATGSQLFADGSLVNTYGKSQTVTLTFACDGSPGTTVTHTYTVKTIGGGPQATRSVTASATIPL
jgi:hypothetical protein